jgi:hypothetical protein
LSDGQKAHTPALQQVIQVITGHEANYESGSLLVHDLLRIPWKRVDVPE